MTSSALEQPVQPVSNEIEEVKQELEEINQNKDFDSDLPLTMRAWIFSSFGNPLECVSISSNAPLPIISKNQILVRVHYASMNPIDYKLVQGILGPFSPNLPSVVGMDFSGTVVGIGPKVTKFKLGQSVYGQGKGSWAEFCAVSENACELKPDNLSFMEAAAIPLVTQTSYQALLNNGKCTANTKLLVLGGSTSCGLMGMQIATAVGCKEITCTSSSEQLCEENGAHRVINYKESDWTEELKDEQFDLIYDCVGGAKAWTDAGTNRVISNDGIFVTIVGDDPKFKLSAGFIMSSAGTVIGRKFLSFFGNASYSVCLQKSSENLEDISKLIVEGKLKPILDASSPFKFEQGMELFEMSMKHTAKGKLVLQILEDNKTEIIDESNNNN